MVTQLDSFQALADPTRRLIVEALRKGERPVNDIVEQAGIHQSGVSRHLRILHKKRAFVSMRPRAAAVLLAPAGAILGTRQVAGTVSQLVGSTP